MAHCRRRRSRLRGLLVLTAAMALAGPVLAAEPVDRDVSSAQLVTGGLTLAGAPLIAAVSEDVFVSEDQIRLRYRVRNPTTGPAVAEARFALPTMSLTAVEQSTPSIPDADQANFLDARITVDGEAVRARIQQRALLRGVDRTATLTALKIPIDEYADADAVAQALDRLDPAQKARLRALKLVYDGDDGLRANWDVQTSLTWRQAFAAGGDHVVELDYSPSVGVFPHPACCAEGWLGAEAMARARRAHCVGADIVQAVQRQNDSGDVAEAHYSEAFVDLDLAPATGGTIGEDHLTVDKGEEANLVSFCGAGVVKTGPTRFELRRKAAAGGQKISVLFLDWQSSQLEGPP